MVMRMLYNAIVALLRLLARREKKSYPQQADRKKKFVDEIRKRNQGK